MKNTINSSNLEKGILIKVDGEVWEVLNKEFFKPGKGAPVIRTKLKNISTGKTKEVNFRNNEEFPVVELEIKSAKFLYCDRHSVVFELENKERVNLPLEEVEDKIKYLSQNSEANILFLEEKPFALQLSPKVSLKVVEAPPALKGNTVSGATKTVKLETGLKINVPIFISEGEKIIVNTETGEYVERDKS